MKVLVANPSADLYGSDRMLLEAVRGLVRHGHEVLVTYTQPGPLLEQLEVAGARVQHCPAPVVRKANLTPRGLVELFRDVMRGLPAMARLVRRERPDVVYVNTVTIPFWLAVCRALRVPAVVHIHEAEASVHPIARFGLNAPTTLARLIVYNSETSRSVGRLGPARRRPSTVVRNGVSGPPSVVPPRAHLDPPVSLVYVGRLSPRKGVDVAVRALGRLRQEGLDTRLTLVGAVFPGYEWYEQELHDLAATLGLEAHCEFAGFQGSVWPWIAQADVVLVPSRAEESFGNAVIEAALSARPVVLSDHSGLREARHGLGAAVPVPADDVVALADAVRELVTDWPQVRQRAMDDAEFVRQEYAPARYQDDVVAAVISASRDPDRRVRRR